MNKALFRRPWNQRTNQHHNPYPALIWALVCLLAILYLISRGRMVRPTEAQQKLRPAPAADPAAVVPAP